jgi:hypothetical protein
MFSCGGNQQQVLWAAVRFSKLFSRASTALLACIRVLCDVDDNGAPQCGSPFLTVLQSPVAAPLGRTVDPAKLWPDMETLAPVGLPVTGYPVSFLLASVSLETRTASSRAIHLSNGIVVAINGLEMCEMGWTVTSTPAAPDYRAFYSRSVSSFTNVTDAMYVGADEPPATITAEQTIAYAPVFPPSLSHTCFPAGIIWDAKIGSRDFLASLRELHQDSIAEVKGASQLVDHSSILHAFLDAVAENPAHFMVPCVPRSSIAESLERILLIRNLFASHWTSRSYRNCHSTSLESWPATRERPATRDLPASSHDCLKCMHPGRDLKIEKQQ